MRYIFFFLFFIFIGCKSNNLDSSNNYNENFIVTNIVKNFYFMDPQERNSFFKIIENESGEISKSEAAYLDEWFGPDILLDKKIEILKKAKETYESNF